MMVCPQTRSGRSGQRAWAHPHDELFEDGTASSVPFTLGTMPRAHQVHDGCLLRGFTED